MPRIVKKQVVFLKQEATQGTAVTTAATDALLVEAFEFNPNFELVKRNYFRNSLDSLAALIGKRLVQVKFKTEVKGSGTAGTAYTPLGAAIQATGMTETISAGVSVTYAPTSAAASASYLGPGKSVTIEWFADGVKHVIAGCVGKKTLNLEAGKIGYFEFEFTGLYAEPTDATAGSQTYNATKPPLVMGVTFTVHTLAAVIQSLKVDDGVEIAERISAAAATGLSGLMISGRNPMATIDPEMELIATHNFFNKLTTAAEASMSIVVGATAGNILTATWPKAQYVGPKYGNRNGIMTLEMQIQLNQNAGDDYESLVFT